MPDDWDHLSFCAFHFDAKNPDLKLVSGSQQEHNYKYPFKSLKFEGVTVSDPDILLISDSDAKVTGVPGLILGMGVLRQLHLYIAYREHNIYVTAASAH